MLVVILFLEIFGVLQHHYFLWPCSLFTFNFRQSYDEAKEFIDIAKEKMRRAEEIKERKELERKSATKIQSWWRMMMVRRGLGQYKKKKKAVPKDEKSGKKKR